MFAHAKLLPCPHNFAGKPIKGRALGGSVSAGWRVSVPYPVFFERWLNESFPVHSAARVGHRIINQARPAITFSLFALCARELLPEVGGWVGHGRSTIYVLHHADTCIVAAVRFTSSSNGSAGCRLGDLGVCSQ